MSLSRRNQLFTDELVQGELLYRVITYWFLCLTVVSLLVVGWSMYSGPPRPLSVIIQDSLLQNGPALLGSIVLLPIVLVDVIKVSSRFVGPIHHVRNVLRRAASGEPTRPIALRKDDFWQELALYANHVVVRQLQLRGNEDDDHATQHCLAEGQRNAATWQLPKRRARDNAWFPSAPRHTHVSSLWGE